MNDVEDAIIILDNFLQEAHRIPGFRLKLKNRTSDTTIMKNVNNSFNNYRNALSTPSSDTDIEATLNIYIHDRKTLHHNVLKNENECWQDEIKKTNNKDLWAKIDWKGNYSSRKPIEHPSIEEFESYFSNLYECDDDKEIENISKLQSNVSIPVLDQPIDVGEIEGLIKDMKNGGFDFNLPILLILSKNFSSMLILLLNFMLYIKYPIHLALSILCVIPKKGNLKMPKNFRGIQMMRAVACLFDRVIARRLCAWMNIEAEQSAFQKGKSTIIQIFILRLLIEICKKKKMSLYIAFVDLEKAFDKVSRYLLLARLVTLGIGNAMLEVLKRIYSYTLCILSFYGCFSEIFITRTGIRQGSSVLLFILFMDGLFIFLRKQCTPEEVIGAFHALVHADDTIIISTERRLFINKCNAMVEYFKQNKLNLNLLKSSYLIINPSIVDHKCNIKLMEDYLEYKSTQVYLGVIISDDGRLAKDVRDYINEKRANVIIKFANFCAKNFLAQLKIKLSVLESCVISSLCYASETWAYTGLDVELVYRYGLKTALGVKQSTSNDITYIESNKSPLKCCILSQQLKFWQTVKEYRQKHPDSALDCLIKQARQLNLKYYNHYKVLETKYTTPSNCLGVLKSEYERNRKEKFEATSQDIDCKLQTYYRINPTLSEPKYLREIMLETGCVLLTKFRCGSHSLNIEMGRYARPLIPRNQRLYICNQGIQTVLHCFTGCPIVLPHLQSNYIDLESIFQDKEICINLLMICKILKLPF